MSSVTRLLLIKKNSLTFAYQSQVRNLSRLFLFMGDGRVSYNPAVKVAQEHFKFGCPS